MFPEEAFIEHHHPHELWWLLFQHVTLKADSFQQLILLGLWKKIWTGPCYHPSWLMKRKIVFMPFLKCAACCCYRVWERKTAKAVTAFTHWENEAQRNVQMSAGVEREGTNLPELRLAWDSLEPFPNIVTLEHVCVKRRLKKISQSLWCFPVKHRNSRCHTVISKSSVLNSCSQGSLWSPLCLLSGPF